MLHNCGNLRTAKVLNVIARVELYEILHDPDHNFTYHTILDKTAGATEVYVDITQITCKIVCLSCSKFPKIDGHEIYVCSKLLSHAFDKRQQANVVGYA